MTGGTYRIPESVIEDTKAFRFEVEKRLRGDTSPVAFRAIRVPMGIYEQRENDTFMVRVRGAAGVFLSHQIKRIAELAEKFGNGIVHVTTRQDLQIHRVLISDTPAILDSLLEVGLSPRGGGGNTVRNVSACRLAGVCVDEVFDVTPYAIALTEYLTTDRANFNLPRKFKAAFSGCGKDCALCSVADLGFFAHERDGIKGFSVYAGGGMGAHSALSVLIEEFIPAESIFMVAEAVKQLFDKYGDRSNRHKARLRYVLERVGADEFRRLYREELEAAKVSGKGFPETTIRLWSWGGDSEIRPWDSVVSGHPCPDTNAAIEGVLDISGKGFPETTARGKNAIPQKQAGLFTIPIPLQFGDIESAKLSALAEIVDRFAGGEIRTTQDQDLQLRNIPESSLDDLYNALREIDEALVSAQSIRAVACAGASTCKLGLCLSRGLAGALESELRDIDSPLDAPIRISGCPNSCGQHPVAPIGLYGTAKRVNGKIMPFYTVVAGGRLAEGEAKLAELVARVPAKAVPSMLKEFLLAARDELRQNETPDDLIERWGADYLRKLGEKYEKAPSYDEAPEFYRDFGKDEDFSLAGVGPGECGAGVMDVIALDIDAAKRALGSNDLYEAVVSAARALLVTRGLEPKKDREVFAAFTEHFIDPGWISHEAHWILNAAVDFKLGDLDTLQSLRGQIHALVERVELLSQSLDSNLNFRVEKIENGADETGNSDNNGSVNELDLRGVACPMNFVRAKLQLEQIETGEILDILLDDGEPVRNVPASFAEQGEEVLSVKSESKHFRVRIRKTS
ncbi:MAG: sulfurtransferase TusA family protein [Armatimonadota bacterium]|nr:sulfurtransferase TusA family protein [Armatimonadota bacterium]